MIVTGWKEEINHSKSLWAGLIAGFVLTILACSDEKSSAVDSGTENGSLAGATGIDGVGAGTGGAGAGFGGSGPLAGTGGGPIGGTGGGAFDAALSDGSNVSTGGISGSAAGGTSGGGGSAATGGTMAGAGGLPSDFQLAPTQAVNFSENNDDFNNPERGFYRYADIVDDTNLNRVYSDGYTLVYSYVRLDDYRDAPIAQSVINGMNRGFAAARAAGLKVIPRFAYNFGPWPNSEPDASKSRILEHIAQLQPHLQAAEDVIAVVQAGFIGAWGEWHSSTNDLLDDPQDRRDILEALLDAIPSSRMTQLRYPPYKDEMYGGPLNQEQAFDGSYQARTGHHNDCFLSSDTDVGTYPTGQAERWKVYLEQDTKYVPMGGETCEVHDRGLCPTALSEMQRLHFSYLNRDYHTGVIDRWISDGCYDQIKRSMGYRFVLHQAQVPDAVRPGGAFQLEVTLDNVGWAAPYNARSVQVVLNGPGGNHRAIIQTLDPRFWLPGEPIVLHIQVQLPYDLAVGGYDLAIALPDSSTSLAERSEYAVRFANDNVWVSSGGYNRLAVIQVDTNAFGDNNADVSELTAIEIN